MRFKIERPDFRKVASGMEEQLAYSSTLAVAEAVDGLLDEYKEGVVRAGLGQRLANTWKARVYPQGRSSLDPTGWIYSKAPKLIHAYSQGAVIRPKNGQKCLAIPTHNVPLKGRGKRMTPLEVEGAFNQDLILRPWKNGRTLAFVNVLEAKNKKGWRKATPARLAQGRQVRLVLMFVLVPYIRVEKRLDIEGPAKRWAAQIPALLQKHWR